MIYDQTGRPINNDIQDLLDHFQYECSDYSGDPHDMEETSSAILSAFSNPIMRGEVGRAVLVMVSVTDSPSGPHKKQLARRILDYVKGRYPDEYQQVRTFHRFRE